MTRILSQTPPQQSGPRTRFLVVKRLPGERRSARLLLAAASILILLLLFLVDPQSNHLPACRFHALTGHSCPSCGLTRSFFALRHFDVGAAFGFHPLGPIVCLALLAGTLKSLIEGLSGRGWGLAIEWRSRRTFSGLILGLWVCLWLSVWGVRLNAERRAQQQPAAAACDVASAQSRASEYCAGERFLGCVECLRAGTLLEVPSL